MLIESYYARVSIEQYSHACLRYKTICHHIQLNIYYYHSSAVDTIETQLFFIIFAVCIIMFFFSSSLLCACLYTVSANDIVYYKMARIVLFSPMHSGCVIDGSFYLTPSTLNQNKITLRTLQIKSSINAKVVIKRCVSRVNQFTACHMQNATFSLLVCHYRWIGSAIIYSHSSFISWLKNEKL